jgi:uncharacterized membrane protein
MSDFFAEYFIDPIKYDTGYNIVNTITYAIILAVAVFAVYRILKKLKIDIDKKFFFSLLPFILLGGILRSVEDLIEHNGGWQPGIFVLESSTGIGRNTLLITPLMYFFIFALAFSSLMLAIIIQRKFKIEYYKSWLAVGTAMCIFSLTYIGVKEFFALWAIALITLSWALIFLAIKAIAKHRKIERLDKFLSRENMIIIMAHMFDATTTFVSIQYYPYWEQHVVAGFFIGMFGPWVMFLLKLPVILAALYVIDNETDGQKNIFIKIAVLMLGLGPGVRNGLRLIMGV